MTMTERKSDRDGFTLAELLIVVAIIGVLVAISIPILNKNLEKSREAHDIYTMRAVAALAVDYYYSGATNETSARALGLGWWGKGGEDNHNAFGAYDPTTGKFCDSKDSVKAYGKGTKVDGGTEYSLGESTNHLGAYLATADYTNAVCMIAIYPEGNNKHIDIYWKDKNGPYIGGAFRNDDPNYSIRIPIS